MIKKILSLLAIVLICHNAFSIDKNDALAKGSIKGFVFDSTANQPLEYATISLVKADNNAIITGTISDASGFFKISGIDYGIYNLEVTFIGYFTKKISGIEINSNKNSIDLGQIELKSASKTMEEVVVKADRPTVQYKIDKKVINVSQQHTSASGTAAELLENIPSVTVDIDGNVSLRGSTSFTVLIDGKPTVLQPSEILTQIPASQIENIEIITNPSAKFDPDGVSGIINIIMKKNRLQGFSGIFNLNGGTQNRYGGDFLITYRKNKFNFYVGTDLNNQEFIGESTTKNRSIKNDTITYLNSSGEFTRGRFSKGVRGGLDYSLNAFNTVSLGFRVGNRSGSGNSTLNYNSWDNPSSFNESYLSKENSDRGGDFYTATLDYNHNFSKKGHTLTGQFIFEKSNSSDSDISKVIDNSITTGGQKSIEAGPETEYRFKLDYTLPTGEKNKFEAGLQSRIELENTSNDMYEYNSLTSLFEFQQLYSHKVDYNTNIHSAYSTYSGEHGKFGYQIGLRGEYTYRFISLKGENKDFTTDRLDYYPTLHISYELPSEQQVMASYTRRIARSHGYNLEPFLTWEDAHNVRIGNPSLKPQFIDSYELSYQKSFGKNSISADLYYRITNNKVERIRSIYQTSDPQYAETIIFLNSIDNVGKDYSFGSEIMLGLDFTKWWHIDIMGNLYNYQAKGDLMGVSFDKSSFNWNSRLNNTFKIGKNTRVQLNGMYNSATVTAQGKSEGFLMTNLAAKQDFMNNKLSLTLQIRDIFQTSGHETSSEGTDFYSYRKFKPNGPVVSMTITLKLNNYKPDRKRQQSENNMEEMDIEN